MTKIVNLTKNPIKILKHSVSGGITEITIPSTEDVKIVISRDSPTFFDGIKINTTRMYSKKNILDKYPKEEGTIYIVSPFVYAALQSERDDIFVTDEPIKEDGKTVSCKSLARKINTVENKQKEALIEFVREQFNKIETNNTASIDEALFDIISYIKK